MPINGGPHTYRFDNSGQKIGLLSYVTLICIIYYPEDTRQDDALVMGFVYYIFKMYPGLRVPVLDCL